MNDEIKAVYCDFAIDVSSSVSTLLEWIRQYLAVFINEAERDFPQGESSCECLYIGFTLFYGNNVDFISFGGEHFTNDYGAVMAFVNSLEAEEPPCFFQRIVPAAINASISKLKSGHSGKFALVLFTDAYEAFDDSINPNGAIDVACLFVTEKISSNSVFLRKWSQMHQSASSMLSEIDRPDFKAITWGSSLFSAFDGAYAAQGGSKSRDLSKIYPMKAWVQDSAYFRIKQFVSITYVGNF